MLRESFLTILFIALSIDNFIITNHKSATIRNMDWKKTLTYGGIFTGVNILILILAYLASFLFESLLPMNIEFFITVSLLVILGFYYILSATKYNDIEERLDKDFSIKTCIRLAVITSVDTFLVGIVLALVDANFFFVLKMSALYTFIASIIGLRVGYGYGVKFPRLLQGIAGVMFIIFSIIITLFMVF